MDKDDLILVTGGTGLIGSYIIRILLKQGYKNIQALKRNQSNLSYVHDIVDQVDWVTGDLLDGIYIYDLFKNVDYVFHCAAVVSLDPSDVNIMFRSNVEGTSNVVNACLVNGVRKLIFTSSIAALGRNDKGTIIDEQSEWQESKLNSDYGRSKLLSELEVWRGSEEGLKVAIVNPSVVLGNGDWTRSSLKLFSQVSKGSSFYPSGGNGFVDVRDVAELTVRMATQDIVNERIIISGYNLKFKDIMEMIAKEMKVQPPSRPLPGWMNGIIPLMDKVRSLITFSSPNITRSTMKTINHFSNYDNSKSLDLLQARYRPMETTIKDCSEAFMTSAFKPLPL